MKENTFKMITEDGKEVTCNVLFTFDSEETGKSYIVYTDNTKDERGMLRLTIGMTKRTCKKSSNCLAVSKNSCIFAEWFRKR